MERNDFKAISMEHIVAANATATRMLEEIKDKKRVNYFEYRKLYFACMEMFEIVYGNEDGESAYDHMYDILDQLEKENVWFKKDTQNYNIFWNAIITSGEDCMVCNVDEFLKHLRMNFGERAMIVSYLTRIAEKLYPNCNGIKLESYKFELINFEKHCTVSFNGRIPKENITQMLQDIYETYSAERFIEEAKIYLDQHHLEYSKFETEIKDVDNDFAKQLPYPFCSQSDFWYDVQNIDHYYLLMNHKESCTEDFIKTHLLVLKHENNEFNMIYQCYFEDLDDWDEYEEDDGIYEQFRFKNHWDSKKQIVDVRENIIPMYKYSALLDILLHMDDINTIEHAKELMKKYQR